MARDRKQSEIEPRKVNGDDCVYTGLFLAMSHTKQNRQQSNAVGGKESSLRWFSMVSNGTRNFTHFYRNEAAVSYLFGVSCHWHNTQHDANQYWSVCTCVCLCLCIYSTSTFRLFFYQHIYLHSISVLGLIFFQHAFFLFSKHLFLSKYFLLIKKTPTWMLKKNLVVWQHVPKPKHLQKKKRREKIHHFCWNCQ